MARAITPSPSCFAIDKRWNQWGRPGRLAQQLEKCGLFPDLSSCYGCESPPEDRHFLLSLAFSVAISSYISCCGSLVRTYSRLPAKFGICFGVSVFCLTATRKRADAFAHRHEWYDA